MFACFYMSKCGLDEVALAKFQIGQRYFVSRLARKCTVYRKFFKLLNFMIFNCSHPTAVNHH